MPFWSILELQFLFNNRTYPKTQYAYRKSDWHMFPREEEASLARLTVTTTTTADGDRDGGGLIFVDDDDGDVRAAPAPRQPGLSALAAVFERHIVGAGSLARLGSGPVDGGQTPAGFRCLSPFELPVR